MTLYKRGKYWYMDFQESGIRIAKSTRKTNKAEALIVENRERRLLRWEVGPQPKTDHPPTSIPISFSDAIERAYRERWSRNKTGKETKRKLQYCNKLFGNPLLSEIDETDVLRLRNILRRKKRADATINRYLAALKTLFIMAGREWRAIDQIPFIKLTREFNQRLRIISEDEEAELIKTLRMMGKDPRSYAPHVADLVEVLIDTGMRLGEALQLIYRQHIDEDHHTINLYSGMTKNKRPRCIPMTTRAKRVLHKRSRKFKIRLFPFKNSTVGHIFAKARKKVGLEHDKEFVLHACRHTCASRMVQRGVDLYLVKQILGHSSITVTERYAHLNVDRLWDGIKVLEKDYVQRNYRRDEVENVIRTKNSVVNIR